MGRTMLAWHHRVRDLDQGATPVMGSDVSRLLASGWLVSLASAASTRVDVGTISVTKKH